MASKKPLLHGEEDEPMDAATMAAQFEEQILREVDSVKGLSDAVAAERLDQWGPNELKDEEVNVVLKFLSYFWGPMPIMIWIAIITEFVKALITGDGWEDFAVLFVLQVVNGGVGFVEERNAGNAIAALKEKLKPECWVVRHGPNGEPRHEKLKASALVPGDVIELKLGDVVPADCILLGDPEDPRQQLQVDESALTGESLPRTAYAHQKIKMSASVKMGEQKAVVVATGANTFYGKAASLMNVDSQGRFQKILFKITLALLVLSLILCAIIFTILLVTNDQGSKSKHAKDDGSSRVLNAVSVVIVLLVASIPIAMQVVCTSTMAVGSRRLADKKVIVARLSAIEELAGMTVLCSDKTGTLTKNQLTLNEPRRFGDMEEDELKFMAALSTPRTSKNLDAIDKCMLESVPSERDPGVTTEWTRERLDTFETLHFEPFNPVSKRTEVIVRAPNGDVFRVSKGAPQVVLRMALENQETDPSLEYQVSAAIQDLADRGYRALGLAVSYTGEDEPTAYRMQALISLYDPPRDDTAETIKLAEDGGVEVKMVTGDQKAIAVETCRRLDMGTEIFTTEQLDNPHFSKEEILERIVKSNGFAEVMPEHKFNIVQALRESGLVVGMTGDGVNDAPALKRADIGIAVEGATDAAKAAADIVLVEPGLSVIIDAILRSRKIFQRMRNYAIYRIACTIQLLFFFFFAVIAVHPSNESFYGKERPPTEDCDPNKFDSKNDPWKHGGAFTLPVIALVVITILNDGTIITISHDKVVPANSPQKWDLREVTVIASVLGLVACLGSMVLLVEALRSNCTNPDTFFGHLLGNNSRHYVTYGEVQTVMYLKISLSDFLTVFAGRTRTFFWERRPGYALAIAFVFATTCSTVLSLFWPFRVPGNARNAYYQMGPLHHNAYSVLTVWVYCLLWFIAQDLIKYGTYRALAMVWSEDEERMRDVTARAHVSKMITDDDRMQSRRGGNLMREGSILRREASQLRGGVAAVEDRMHCMEQEIRELRALLAQQQGGRGQAQNGGPAAAGH